MEPRISVITLAVEDLERSLAFYRDGLGLPTNGIVGTEFEHGAVAFFKLHNRLTLAIYPRAYLSADANIDATRNRLGAVSIGQLVSSREEVDAVLGQAASGGGLIVDPGQDRFWGGYSGYFRDPDGHLWEIAWNPDWSE